MFAIYMAATPDRGLAWLIYVLLAFLLVSIVVGALFGPKVLDGRAPGALRENDTAAPVQGQPAEH